MSATPSLLPDPLPADPLAIAASWFSQAWNDRVQPNPDAMVLATCDAQGQPSARVVLCKQLVAAPGYLVFHTNYESRKGRELEASGRAAVVLFWDALHRQVRIEGPVVRATPQESDLYFKTRPWQRQIGAWASRQSAPVASRQQLVEAVAATAARFSAPDPLSADPAASQPVAVPRPPNWGGYRLWVESIELWLEGEYRIHDRARWTRSLAKADEHSFSPGPWSGTRLNP
jgi:pyridoxamine 5'-phosphate oxidase